MEKQNFDLAWLLAPLERAAFFERYWEKEVLHVHRPEVQYYNDVLSIRDLEQMIANPRSFRPVDLPGSLDIGATVTLVRSLHERGFLSISCER